MEDKLNQRSNKFTIVLNDNELHLFKDSVNILNKMYGDEKLGVLYIAIIKHDRDKDENGNIKTMHYHVVLSLNNNCRIGTLLNKICDLFHCNENQVTIDKCSSLEMQSRYLLHLDDFDKEDYFQYEVVTNKRDVFENYINLEKISDLKELISVVKRCHYDLETIMITIANYDRWRKYINDLIVNNHRKGTY